jgi:hypothetical protein
MPRRAARSRKQKPLSESLHRRLSLYTLAAGGAGRALAWPAQAQIVYTPAHETISRNQRIDIDLNHDGITDVAIREIPWFLGGDGFFPGNSLQAEPRRAGGGIKQGLQGDAAALAPGSKIGPGDPFYRRAAMMAEDTSSAVYYYGSWANARNSYLGIRFLINGETHYGWARLNSGYDYHHKDIFARLTGYAYETQPDTPIRAGDTGQNDSGDDPESKTIVPACLEKEQPALGPLALGAKGTSFWRGDRPR